MEYTLYYSSAYCTELAKTIVITELIPPPECYMYNLKLTSQHSTHHI